MVLIDENGEYHKDKRQYLYVLMQILSFLPLHGEDIEEVLKTISFEERQKAVTILQVMNKYLEKFDCRADIRYFYPIVFFVKI